jgi:hypothetical protein
MRTAGKKSAEFPNALDGQVLWAAGLDLSRLAPRTIDPRIVGPAAALINLSAFFCNESVRNGWISQADAARGFDEVVAETERLFGQQPKSGG